MRALCCLLLTGVLTQEIELAHIKRIFAIVARVLSSPGRLSLLSAVLIVLIRKLLFASLCCCFAFAARPSSLPLFVRRFWPSSRCSTRFPSFCFGSLLSVCSCFQHLPFIDCWCRGRRQLANGTFCVSRFFFLLFQCLRFFLQHAHRESVAVEEELMLTVPPHSGLPGSARPPPLSKKPADADNDSSSSDWDSDTSSNDDGNECGSDDEQSLTHQCRKLWPDVSAFVGTLARQHAQHPAFFQQLSQLPSSDAHIVRSMICAELPPDFCAQAGLLSAEPPRRRGARSSDDDEEDKDEDE